MSATSVFRVRSVDRRSTVAGPTGFPATAVFGLSLFVTAVWLAIVGAMWAPAGSAAEPGGLDLSFSQNGRAETSFGVNSFTRAEGVAIQADGKAVAAGYTSPGGNFALARYNTDGTLDTSFDGDGGNGNGKVITDFGGGDVANAVAIQADGKIVVAGYTSVPDSYNFALARYNTNGTLDTSFDGDSGNGNGKVITGFGGNEWATAVAIQPNGKIVAAGMTNRPDSANFAVARYNTNGTLDTSFDGDSGNGNGKVITGFGGDEEAQAVAIQPFDGKIVAAGWANDDGELKEFALARYTTTGELDGTFDDDGRVEEGIAGNHVEASAVAIQTNGRIVAAGSTANSVDRDFELMRFLTTGALDDSFDGNGKQATEFGGGDHANGVAIQSGDGKIVAAGWTTAGIDGTFDFALARYDTSGGLDASFGGGDGKVTTHWAGGNDNAHAVALQPDRKIVAAGSVSTFNTAMAVARYHAAAN